MWKSVRPFVATPTLKNNLRIQHKVEHPHSLGQQTQVYAFSPEQLLNTCAQEDLYRGTQAVVWVIVTKKTQLPSNSSWRAMGL
jgi:hypothetical protein